MLQVFQTTERIAANVTIEAHPDDFQRIISGILIGLQVFQTVAPFIIQIIAIEKGQPTQIKVHSTQIIPIG